MKPWPSTCRVFSAETRWPVLPRSGSSLTFSKIVSASVSPGEITSEPITPALRKLAEKPSAGTTEVARVTRGLTVTMKASPPCSTEPL